MILRWAGIPWSWISMKKLSRPKMSWYIAAAATAAADPAALAEASAAYCNSTATEAMTQPDEMGETILFCCQLPQRTLAVVGRCKHRPRLSGYHHRNASETATCMMRCQGYSLMTTAVMNGFTV